MTKLVFLPLLALAACQAPSSTNEANEAANQREAPVREIETLPPNETVVIENTSEAPAPTVIPAAFQGRWGLVPADCTSTRGDAKGLLTISGDMLVFYESRAMLTRAASSGPERFSGAFAFTGEGQNWARNVTLELRDGALLRSDEEVTEPLRYTRCS